MNWNDRYPSGPSLGLGLRSLASYIGLSDIFAQEVFPKAANYLRGHPKLSKGLWYLFYCVSAAGAITYGFKPFVDEIYKLLPITSLNSDDELYKCLQKHVVSKAKTTKINLLEASSSAYYTRSQAKPTNNGWGMILGDEEQASNVGMVDEEVEIQFRVPGPRVFGHNWTLFIMDTPHQERGSERLHLRTLWFNNNPVRSLLEEAWAIHKQESEETKTTSIFHHSYSTNWELTKTKLARPLDTVDVANDQKERLVSDLVKYLHPSTKAWYQKRGIPHRRGYLFHGPPGTGKSSLAAALASYFNTSLYTLSLSDGSLSDHLLENLLNRLPEKSILLLEDVDSAGIRREHHNETSRTRSKVTLAGLLNALDGASAPEGHILIMSSNTPEKLDPALVRAGRVDLKIEFKNADREVVIKIFERMVMDTELDYAKLQAKAEEFATHIPDDGFSPAEIQGYLIDHANDIDGAIEAVSDWVAATYVKREEARKEAEESARHALVEKELDEDEYDGEHAVWKGSRRRCGYRGRFGRDF